MLPLYLVGPVGSRGFTFSDILGMPSFEGCSFLLHRLPFTRFGFTRSGCTLLAKSNHTVLAVILDQNNMRLLGMLWGTLWFVVPAEPFATVLNTHRLFSIFFFFTGIFFRAIAFAFLEGLPTFDPYVPLP